MISEICLGPTKLISVSPSAFFMLISLPSEMLAFAVNTLIHPLDGFLPPRHNSYPRVACRPRLCIFSLFPQTLYCRRSARRSVRIRSFCLYFGFSSDFRMTRKSGVSYRRIVSPQPKSQLKKAYEKISYAVLTGRQYIGEKIKKIENSVAK